MSENEYKQIKNILRRNRNKITLLPNVVGIGIGKKIVKGRITNVLAIRVYVTKKIPSDSLKKVEKIPNQIEGTPIDVIEVGKLHLLGANYRENQEISSNKIDMRR